MTDRVAHNIGCNIAAEKIPYAIEHMDEMAARDEAELEENK